jgi:hypothetical protein
MSKLTAERAAKMRRVALVDQYCEASNQHQCVYSDALYCLRRGGDTKKYVDAMAAEFERLSVIVSEMNRRLPRTGSGPVQS